MISFRFLFTDFHTCVECGQSLCGISSHAGLLFSLKGEVVHFGTSTAARILNPPQCVESWGAGRHGNLLELMVTLIWLG